MDGCFFQQILGRNVRCFFLLTQENASGGFTLKPIERPYVFMSQPLGIFERFQYLNFETNFLKK